MASRSCRYRNSRDRMVVVRCSDSRSFCLERVLLPAETVQFSSPPGCRLQVWMHSPGGPLLIENLPVETLSGTEDGSVPAAGGGLAGA